ncbi:MAG TPA: hypothetical protein VMV16_05005 [Solirubrobacteraceae bacterium]|nr:hypothetical protein [Solirubrobacteraceae bacterium]
MRRAAPTVLAAALAIAYLIVAPTGADLPAQLLRVKLFGAEGFGIWNNWWYGGHDITAYSVLFPPLAWLPTPQLLAALASVGTAAAFEALTHDVYGDDAWIGATWFGAATVTELLSGRLAFAFGLCGTALVALLLERRRPRWASALALLTTLASPVAALFAALAGATFALGGLQRRFWPDIAGGIVAMSAAILPLGALAIAFPQSGYQPFAFGTLWPLLVIGVALVVAAQRSGHTTLVGAVVLYVLGCVAAYAVHTAVGSNAARLGELTAGPLAALLLAPRRAWLPLALAAVPLTYIQVHDAITDLEQGEAANTAAYYRPLIRFLEAQPGAAEHTWRVEVPFTAGHWEAYRLAPEIPLARGWERQLDIADDGLFYGGALNAGSYDAWLHRLAVRYVAVADAPGDYSARGELELIRRGLPYLRLVAHLRQWRVYAVAKPSPIATGAGRLLSMGPNSLTLAIAHPGRVNVRVRWSPYWQLTGVRGCVAPSGEFTLIEARGSGRARLGMAFSFARVDSRAPRCD